MVKYVKMTLNEYDDLVAKQNEPSEILQETVTNYKTKLDEALATISELEASLSKYIIGGVKPREEPMYPDQLSAPTLSDSPNLNKIKTTRARWEAWEIERLHDSVRVGRCLSDLMVGETRTEAAIRSKLNQLHIFVVKGRLMRGDRYE